MLIKLLYKLAPEKFNSLVFDNKHASFDWRSKCEVAYVDGNGVKYYTFTDPFNDLNIVRIGHCETLLKQMEFGLSKKELNKFWDVIEKAIDEIVNDMTAKGRIKNFAVITAAIQEARTRDQMIIHPDILMELAATSYIREDENPAEINRTIHEEKMQQFKDDEAARDYFFFDNRGFGQFLPQLKHFQQNWDKFIVSKMKDLSILNEVMEAVSSQITSEK